MTETTALTIQAHEGEPRVLDTDLAERRGMARPTNIRRLIEANREELESFGPLHSARANPGAQGGRPTIAYYLTEEQALDICTLSRTEAGKKLRPMLIKVFQARRRGELEAAKPALPDFTNPAAAARAFADQYEARQIADQRAKDAEAQAALAETKVAELAPLALVGKMAASRSLSLGEFLRTLPNVNIVQAQSRLVDMGVLYRIGKKLRVKRGPHAKHFLEGQQDDWGGVTIFPNAQGRALLIGFYRDRKLPMRAGCKPQSLPKALA